VTAGERVEVALELFDLSVDLMRTRLRREQPGRSAEDIDAEVRSWLRKRPGAESGDSWGRPRRP
jgi:Xaa-Pro aminopeptidase